jgi:uridylate kinase
MRVRFPKEKIVISVGGSLIVPEGIDVQFLKNLNTFVRSKLVENSTRQFFLVCGGGATTRRYQQAAREVVQHELPADDLDWLGIHPTRLNAHLLRTIFRDIAHLHVIEHYDIIRKASEPVVIASGWKPGWSTDFCAILLAEDYQVPTVINMSNISQVYDKDPNLYSDAKPYDKISWVDFRRMVGDTWTPGMNAPFDPIASQRAQEIGVKVIVLGKDFDNLEKYYRGEDFLGTVIE